MAKNIPKTDIKIAPRVAVTSPPVASTSQQNMLSEAEVGSVKSPPDPKLIEDAKAARGRLVEALGQITLLLLTTHRFRHITVDDISQYIMEPLVRDRLVIAKMPSDPNRDGGEMVGTAIWANVSDEVDARAVPALFESSLLPNQFGL